MRTSLALAIASVLFAFPAAAQKSTESAIRGSGRYGSAGCGLGSLAFGDTPGPIQIIAATTNYFPFFLPTQLLGMTAGTSNCGRSIFESGTLHFVEANREALAKDISRGGGEAIGALTVINSCESSAAVGTALQKNFKTIFPSEAVSNEDVTKAILETLHSEKSTGCFKKA